MTGLFLVCGVICILYGLSVMMIGSGTAFFIVWFLAGAFFELLALLTGRHMWHLIPRWLLAVCGLILAAGLLLFAFVETRIISCFGMAGEPGLSYIVVLGAQVHEDGPSLVLKYRLDRASEYLEENPETLCIVSGGQGSNEPFAEAEGMKRYLVQKGIDGGRIITEDRSENTAQNIRFSKKLLPDNPGKVGIVTNNFHMYRALMIARREGLDGAVGIAADSTKRFLPHNMLREFFAIVKEWMV